MDKNIGETKEEEDGLQMEEDGQQMDEDELDEVYRPDSLDNKSRAEIKINKESINQLKMIETIKKNEAKVNKYFKDKSKYEKKIKEIKVELGKKKHLSVREKRRDFKNSLNSLKCIKCKKKGGTLFTNENNVLKEVCNASVQCKLNVEIKRIVVDDLLELERIYTKTLNDVKKQIIIANMDLLFKYKSSNETVELFEKSLNVSLEKTKEDLRLYSDLISSIVNKNKDSVNEKMNTLKDEINGLNNDKPFGVEGGISNVNKYITNIIPLLKELRQLKYSYSGTECESRLDSTPCSESIDNVYVKQIPITIKEMEVDAKSLVE